MRIDDRKTVVSNIDCSHTRSLGAPGGYRGFAVFKGPIIPCDLSHGFRNYPIHFHINPVSMLKMMGRGECICFGDKPKRNVLKRARMTLSDPMARISGRQTETGCRGGNALIREEKGNTLVRF